MDPFPGEGPGPLLHSRRLRVTDTGGGGGRLLWLFNYVKMMLLFGGKSKGNMSRAAALRRLCADAANYNLEALGSSLIMQRL